ncbi:MAG TPA: AMP-binding protein [Candidatus Acidoferrales bacterium]|nr:AMP-binding protein [Candidatus Acidoferrales bacterium]
MNEKDLLHTRFLKAAKRHWSSLCMADSTGKELNYGQALTAALLLSRQLGKHCAGEQKVGILLPSSVGGALANIALLFAGKIPVNLNFTVGREALESAIRQCAMRTIITSRAFVSQANLEPPGGAIFLEDLFQKAKPIEKLFTPCVARFFPGRLLRALCQPLDSNSLATVIFSSGSSGEPKGVMLSHKAILANIDAVAQLFPLNATDRMLGVIPFFHAFGFTMTLWFPLLLGLGTVYHSKPLEAKTIGDLCFQHKATILCSTPTFYLSYIRGVAAQKFSSLRYALAGAEKLRAPIAAEFKKKIGLDLLEGYGCTEMGPVVSVNRPKTAAESCGAGFKAGTVGRPVPGVAVKVVDPVTSEELPRGSQGVLCVRGPSRMLGYLGRPDATAQVLRDGWYITGDIASIDEDGFITISDRLSRFSKIAGEMVPHSKVEEAVNQILKDSACAVASLPDAHRGERLVVFYTHQQITPEELWDNLSRTELPRLWLPKREDIHRIDSIPLLGSGKIDLNRIKAVALRMANS